MFVQSSSAGSSGAYSAPGQFSPVRMSGYNQLAASSLLNQQYAAVLGLGKPKRANSTINLHM